MTDPNHTIAFMGLAGANADLACRQAQPYMHTLPCASFEGVFEAVADGKAAMGMIPIENSQAGRVAEIHYLLPRVNLHIVGEHLQKVEHQLAAPKGATLESIKHVYSHPQALLQCRDFLRKHELIAHPHSNSAGAAQDVGQWNDPTRAALCSNLAAELYGLDIIEAGMQDAEDNATLFIMVAREPLEPEALQEAGSRILTSALFSVRNIPAALYKCLGGFATNGVNMIKLESYIAGVGSAQFFITFEGNPEERPVQLALEELGFFTNRVTVLGVYPADPTRFNG